MASLKFDVTCDNKQFIDSLKEVQKAIKDANDALSGVSGSGFDFSDSKKSLEDFNQVAVKFCENIARQFDELTKKAEAFKFVLDAGGATLKNADANKKEIVETKAQLEEALAMIKQLQEENTKVKAQFIELGNAIKDSDVAALNRFREIAGGTFEEVREKAEALAESIKIDEATISTLNSRIQKLKDERAQWNYLRVEANHSYANTGDQKYFDQAQEAIENLDRIKGEIDKYEDLARITREHLAASREEMQALTAAVDGSSNAMGTVEEKAKTIQQRLSEARQKMLELIEAGKEGTSEFYDIAQEAGNLKDQMNHVNAVMQYFSDSNRYLNVLKTGLQGVAGAAGLVTGVMGLFNTESEKMEQIQTKIQSVLGIIAGLETTYNLVKKDSVLMLAIEEVRTWAVAKARGVQAAATTAATVAQEGLNVAMRATPWGAIISLLAVFGTAIYGIVTALGTANDAEEEAKKKAEEHAEALRKEKEAIDERNKRWAESVANSAADQIIAYRKLQQKWNELGNDLKAKEKFIYDNSNAFNNLGVSVNSVTAAENFFVNNTRAVVDAILARARAEAYEESIKESVKEEIKIKSQNPSTKTGDYILTTHEGVSVVDIREKYKEVTGKELSLENKSLPERITTKQGVPQVSNLMSTGKNFRESIDKRYGDYVNYGNGNDWYVDEKGITRLTKQGAEKVNKGFRRYANQQKLNISIALNEKRLEQERLAEQAKIEEENRVKSLKAIGVDVYATPAKGGGGRGNRVSSASRSGSNGTSTSKTDVDQSKAFSEQIKKEIEQRRKLTDLELATREATIKAMEEGTEKTVAQIELDYDRKMEAIRRGNEDIRQKRIEEAKALWDADPKKKGSNFYESEAYKEASAVTYTDAELKNIKAREALAEKERSDALAKLARQETDAMRSYLKEYGTYEQRRLAITEETERKIAEAKTAGERLAAMAQGRMAVEQLDKQQREKGVDWEGVFGNLSLYTAQELEQFKQTLREKLGEEGLKLDEYKTIVNQIDSINEGIISAHEREGGILGSLVKHGNERRRIEMDIAEAKEQQARAQAKLVNAEATTNLRRMDVSRIASNMGIEGDFNTAEGRTAALEAAEKMYGSDKPEYQALLAAFDALDKALMEQTAATDENTAATRKVQRTEKQGEQYSKKPIFEKDVWQTIEQVSANLQSLPGLVASLGFAEDSPLGRAASGIAGTANSAMNAFKDFESGNYVGAVMNGLDALGSFGDTLGTLGIGGFGSSDANLHRDIERLTASNQDLQKAIQNLSEEMEDATMGEALEIYQTQLDMLRKSTAQTQEIMQRSGAAYDKGFLGIKGRHSTNKKIDSGMTDEEWAAISSIVGQQVHSASQFWTLTQKQMHDVATYGVSVWTHLKDLADDGLEDVAQYMDAYADSWEQAKMLNDAINEKLTSTAFDSVYDEFVSMLSDMDSDSHSFAENFEKYMFNAILNQRINDAFKGRLEQWYEQFAEMSKGGLTDDEISVLREGYTALGREGRELRDEVQRITGYGSSSEGSATYNAAKSFTQEQGDILNGRLTAIQINTATNTALGRQIAASLQSMASIASCSSSTNTAVLEIRNMMITSNSYLEDVARYAKATYRDFGEKLDRIILHTDNL